MINKSKQNQGAGDNSTNLQGQSIVINQGISYSDAKEIALDVFKANFIQVKAEALEIACKRAEEITEKILSKITERNPEAIAEFNQPALQDALFTVQKQYAKSGETDLGDLLVDILVDRAAQPKRNMLQIVLDESLNVAPKLTIEQLDTITLDFLLVQTRRMSLRTFLDLQQYIITFIGPFCENLTKEHTYYNHIEYLGCGHVRAGSYGQLEQNLRKTYQAFFSAGFTEDEFNVEVANIEEYRWALMPCFHDPTKLQLTFFDEDVLQKLCEARNVSAENIQKIKNFSEKTTSPPDQVKAMLIAISPLMEKVFEVWNTSPLQRLELTSVGVAIAHANYRRKTGDTMDLSIWIK